MCSIKQFFNKVVDKVENSHAGNQSAHLYTKRTDLQRVGRDNVVYWKPQEEDDQYDLLLERVLNYIMYLGTHPILKLGVRTVHVSEGPWITVLVSEHKGFGNSREERIWIQTIIPLNSFV